MLTRRFLDSHVYIVRHAVLGLLKNRPNLESFKDDFLPWVCKLPHRKSHRTKYADGMLRYSLPFFFCHTYSSIALLLYLTYSPSSSAINSYRPSRTCNDGIYNLPLSVYPSFRLEQNRAPLHGYRSGSNRSVLHRSLWPNTRIGEEIEHVIFHVQYPECWTHEFRR